MWNIKSSGLRQFAQHFFAILLIFLILVLIRYPFFLNSNYYFTADEGILATQILDLLKGGPIVFYYATARTFGLTFGLTSAPFIWVLGPTGLAFNLPATLFYSLYLWTTYLIAKTLIPRTAYLILILMFFTPPFITELTTHNWPHVPAAFFGNLIFLLFIKVKLSEGNNSPIVFFLFFTMGLAIYTYTYSFIFILTIGILYALTHPLWGQIRGKISFDTLVSWFKNKKTKKEIICQLLDMLILTFFVLVVFSYIFGGFGLDIAGISILQINKFNKAALQLLAIIFLRILIDRQGPVSSLRNAKSYFLTRILSGRKHLATVGGVGFLLGISPRIASILTGETTRGGQGHDFDFLPTKLFVHFQDLVSRNGPQLFGFDDPIQDLISNPMDVYWVVLSVLFISLVVIFFFSAFSFVSDHWIPLKNIVALRGLQFKAVHIILLAPILVCIATIIIQHGPETRYLFPLFGILVLWVGIYVDKIQEKVRWFSILVMAVWMGFYSITNYRNYQAQGLIDGVEVVKFKRYYIYDLLEFLETEGISVAYADFGTASKGTFLSDRKINISEFSPNPSFKSSLRERSMTNSHFAIIAKNNTVSIYKNYLHEKRIEFNATIVADYDIFWDFKGNDEEINNLRFLISEARRDAWFFSEKSGA